jgi:CRISPR system Cascade subunit CasD
VNDKEIEMKEYLVFRLYGPMASWGQAAVGGDRPTGLSPTRSAVLGLLGAALGIKRDDEQVLNNLAESILVSSKLIGAGSLIRDYHTAQVPSHSKKVTHRTRKNELSVEKLNTVLSSRDYRCDALWIVAVSLTSVASLTLESLKDALLKPVFTLSLGRKSCPLAIPLAPEIVSTDSLKEALDCEFPSLTRSPKEDRLWLGLGKHVTYFWEGNKNEFSNKNVLTTHPWNDPLNRQRWQFKQYTLHQLSVMEEA